MRIRVFLAVASLALAAIATAQDQPSLKDTFKNDFLIGAAVNESQVLGRNATEDALIKAQFNTITPENALKWERVHPELNRYDFSKSDAYVKFGQQNGMYIVGHTLVWHNQTPKWVFVDKKGKPLTRAALLKRLRDHIHKVVGRYKGQIQSWDVVNEVLDEDGTLRQTPWLKIIGEDYIAKAFQYAHEADPKAQLIYNDYSLENEPKRLGAVKLIEKLKAEGVPITGVGLQDHVHLDWPSPEQLDATITAFSKLGMKVMLTEFDIDVLPQALQGQTAEVTAHAEAQAKLNPYRDGLPDSVQQELAKRYGELFSVLVKHRGEVNRVTFWGVTDRNSWLNNWPVRGRTNYPLLFDREGKPKLAFGAVIAAARQTR